MRKAGGIEWHPEVSNPVIVFFFSDSIFFAEDDQSHSPFYSHSSLYSASHFYLVYVGFSPDRKIMVLGLGNNILFPSQVLSSSNSNTNVHFILKSQQMCHLFERKPSIWLEETGAK